MTPVALDFETGRFAPAFMAPFLVCASTYHPQDGLRLWDTDNLWSMLGRVLSDPTPVLGHGFAYDACCILEWAPEPIRKLLWAKYENDQLVDSIATERIIEIYTGLRGRLALDLLAGRYGVTVTKSCVRTDFGRYYGRPLAEYTKEHRRYMGGDAAELYALYRRQRSRGIANDADICELARGDLWLRLMSNYGIRTDPARVDVLESETQAIVDELTLAAQSWGGMKTTRTNAQIRDDKWFSRDMKLIKRMVLAAYGEAGCPRTDGWFEAIRDGSIDARIEKDPLFGIGTASDVLDESGDPRLEQIAHLSEYLSVRNKDVRMLKAGVYQPIHARFGWNAATTRSTCREPNLQNFRRKKGIRECLMPRPGCCFVETDYPSLELFAVAEICASKLGRFDLAGHLNAGRDYHSVLTGEILRIPYEEVMKRRKAKDPLVENTRVGAKNGNYGLLGYMTDPETFAWYVNHQSRTEAQPKGLGWTEEDARATMQLWRRTAKDPVAYLRYVDTLKGSDGLYAVEIPGTGIVRTGCVRTAAANTGFQGFGAVVARKAGWKLAKAQHITRTMPGRTVNFVHDAFLNECKIEDRTQVGLIQERIMAEALHEAMPHMRIVPAFDADGRDDVMIIDSAAMDHYSKDAKSMLDRKGQLIICQV